MGEGKKNYDQYIPERDYIGNGYKPFGKPLANMCVGCKSYYADLFEKGVTDELFPPNCKGHVTDPIKLLKEEDFLTPEEYEKAVISLDPISWAVSEFGWTARWYQEEMLSCTAKYKVMRCGRRVGKTEGACVGLAHHAQTHRNHAMLVLAPYEAQVANIFQMIRRLIDESQGLQETIARSTLNPHRIEFHNGSYILGFSAGSKTAARSDKVRGQDAHVIYIDEFDYIPDSDIAAVSAILISHPDCQLWTTSTPTGEHKRFYAICTDKNLAYKEFWFTSMEIPHWDDRMELDMRREYNAVHEDSPEWEHEVLAEFGEQTQGVYRNSMIDKSIQEYELGEIKPHEGGTYILGVDWNKTAGTHMVIVQWLGGVFTITDKIIIPRGDFTQIMAVEKIIHLHEQWDFKGIYVDRGYGSTQVEMLKKHGLNNPGSNIHLRLRDFAMQEMIDIRDPATGAIVKKHTKPFLVNALAQQLDEGRLVLPKREDTRVVRDDMAMGVVQQMRNFKIESFSVHGLPKYSQGPEHTLVALQLAVGGFVLAHGDLTRVSLTSNVALGPGFGQSEGDLEEEGYAASSILKDMQVAQARDLDKGKPLFGFSADMSSVREQHKARTSLNQSLRNDKGYKDYMGRKNINGVTRRNV